jgi:2,4-dienoyl-CoA reductase-like NADH-dependent reductase (Old Yellow Enzyme family)/NADPH-dependent 2,4-dienoyl-CoA reductase/sulfur reductase-like enzyme
MAATMQKFPHLFTPIKIAGHTYKNRLLCAPMLFGWYALDKGSDERVYKIVEDRAKGGIAEVVVGETPVNSSDAPDMLFSGMEVDYTQRKGRGFEAYKRYADVIKKHDAIALIEIFHAGHAKNPLPFGEKANPWGPMGFVRPDGVTVEAFDAKKMQKVRDDFVTCSQFMQAAGFDGVLIHGGHGFLFTQFLSPSSNQRTDEYGGSLANRGRFPREILGDIKKNLGPGFIVEMRINGADLVEGGTTNEQTAEFCSTLNGLVDIIHISSGFKSKGYETREFSSHYDPHGINVERAANVKKKTTIPVTVVGGINSPEFAEKIIAEGKVDFVSLGRQLIADPEFPNKAKSGRAEEIRRCLRCYHCYGATAFPFGNPRNAGAPPPMPTPAGMLDGVEHCTINPRANKEVLLDTISKPKGSRKVLVVGGGPGGMQAAITACDRGHKVTLVEKDSSLGGVLHFTDTDTLKVDLKNFKDLLVREVGRRKIDIRLNTEAIPELISKFKPDVVILAIGASPAKPAVPGINTVLNSLDVYKPTCKVGKKVIMVGGGLAGCETALQLADKGHQVIIVEMLDQLASEVGNMALAAILDQVTRRKNITVRTGAKCVEIQPDGVKIETASGEKETIPGDTVVCSLGMSAKRNEVENLRTAAGQAAIFEVGDCVRGAKVFEAVSEGFMAAMKIA